MAELNVVNKPMIVSAVQERPDFVPAWLGLVELYLGQKRWDDLEQVARRLEEGSRNSVEAAVLRARGHLARQEYASARRLLDETIARAPQALWPRVVLSHVLLQEGRDWGAAEQALREILAREPNHAEARRNLAVLLQQQGRADDDKRTSPPSSTPGEPTAIDPA